MTGQDALGETACKLTKSYEVRTSSPPPRKEQPLHGSSLPAKRLSRSLPSLPFPSPLYQRYTTRTAPVSSLPPAKSQIVQSSQSPSHTSHTTNITIRPLPCKGNSLIAARPLKRGTLITSEAPLLQFHNIPTLTSNERYHALETSLAGLSPSKARAFFGLFDAFASPTAGEGMLQKAVGILKTNCLPLTENVKPFSSHQSEGQEAREMDVLGVFQTISRVNHCCVPNAEFSWSEASGEGRLFAVCAIAEGEEVVIDYASGQPFVDRAAFLRDGFGFECACVLCVEGGKGEYLREFERLEDDLVGLQGQARSLTLIRDALDLLEEVGIRDMRVARMHGHALQTALHQGDLKTSQLFARLYLKACVACLGEDHTESEDAEDTLYDLLVG